MPRRKKTTKPKPKEPEIQYVACPVRWHKHKLEVKPSPDRPDLVVAYCGERIVYQAGKPKAPVSSAPDEFLTKTDFVIPTFHEGE